MVRGGADVGRPIFEGALTGVAEIDGLRFPARLFPGVPRRVARMVRPLEQRCCRDVAGGVIRPLVVAQAFGAKTPGRDGHGRRRGQYRGPCVAYWRHGVTTASPRRTGSLAGARRGRPDTFDGSFEGTDEIEIIGSPPKDYDPEVSYEWIHTSGSMPLEVGDLFGDFMVADVAMTDGKKPKISGLTLVYIGLSSHGLEPIDVNVYSKDRKKLIGSVTNVNIGDEVTVDGADLKKGHLESDVLLEYCQ